MTITIYDLGHDIGVAAEELNSCILSLNEAMTPLGDLNNYYEPRNEKRQEEVEQPSGMLGEMGYSVSRLKDRLMEFRTQIDAINRMVGLDAVKTQTSTQLGAACARVEKERPGQG